MGADAQAVINAAVTAAATNVLLKARVVLMFMA
jgi:hypothetical protein